LLIGRERLVVQATSRLGVVRGLRNQRHVFETPQSKDDLSVGERRVGRNETLSSQAPDATNG
jgi:hypothetical protein